MSRRVASIAPDWFDALYDADPDPWRFASSDYEREKYAATLAALPARHFTDGLEVGCSIGILTRQLASRCTTLLALDVAEAALVRARSQCPRANFERRVVPRDWPDGTFDLIVFSEMLYYLDGADIDRTAHLARGSLRPGGCILMVHYLGETDYPTTGDAAAERFIAVSGLTPGLQVRESAYRIDRLDDPGAAPG